MDTTNPEMSAGLLPENKQQTEELKELSNSPQQYSEKNLNEEIKPESLTRKQLGQLRRTHVTVQHSTVKACGHKAKFGKDKNPGNNCVYCWEAYFMTSVDLDFIHTVLTQKGANALMAIHGKKFVRMFHGFLSQKMLPMLAAEINKVVDEQPARIEGSTFDNAAMAQVE